MSVLDHFAILNHSAVDTVDGVDIGCTTNNPCHLWCRWTASNPWLHITRAQERGAPLYLLPRYCFVAFTDVEQNEAGDTLSHTFDIDPWEVGQWRWYYFLGTVSGAESPSRGPLLQHKKLPLPITIDCYSQDPNKTYGYDGYIQRGITGGETWSNIRNAWSGTACNDSFTWGIIRLNNMYTETWRYLTRIIAIFNTSGIPSGAEIQEAALHLYCEGWSNQFTTDPAFNAFMAAPVSDSGVNTADYRMIGNEPLSGAPVYKSAVSVPGWVQLPFNDFGKEFISQGAGAKTKIGLRSLWDAYNAPPLRLPKSQNMTCSIRMAESVAQGTRPFLRVTYLES